MKIYHGTSASKALKTLEEGIKPRGSQPGNWESTVLSNPGMVYLTVAYAPYFSMCASGDEDWGIVEVDTDLLNEGDLMPDEDFLEQASRNQKLPKKWKINGADMDTRTQFFRDHLTDFQHMWKDSVRLIGNLAHHGIVPKKAITRVTTFSPSQNPDMMMMAGDPTISLMNYMVCGAKYRALSQWFAAREMDPTELFNFGIPMDKLPEIMALDIQKRLEAFKNNSQLGLKIIGEGANV